LAFFSVSSGLGIKYLNFFHLADFYRGMAQFIAFGALGKCAYFHFASPTALSFNAPLFLIHLFYSTHSENIFSEDDEKGIPCIQKYANINSEHSTCCFHI
jgi:hypothetical protein